MSTARVLIVGAGPTGLMLAAELARRGVYPRVIDAGPRDHKESRAVAVVARSLEMLDDHGIANDLIERGIPLRSLDFYTGSKRIATLDTTAVDSPFPFDLCVPQWQTTSVLRNRAEELGVHIEWSTRMISLSQGDRLTATVETRANTEQWDADWIVGCDGSHSVVRAEAGIGWHTADLHRGFILGDLTSQWNLSRDRFHVWFSRRGLVAIFPMPGGVWRVLASTPTDDPPRPARLDHFVEAVADRTPLDADLKNLEWSSTFVAREGLADSFRRGRVLLAGDAAHSHSPIGGQGMNTGLQDAYNLGWKLASRIDGAPDELLDSYATERRPMAKAVVDATSTATRVATQDRLFGRRARRHALRLFSQFSGVQRQFSAGIGEHLVNYRDSALVGQDWAYTPPQPWSDPTGDGPQAGEVFRDAYLEVGDNVLPLRHLLRHPGHHLLVFTADIGDPRTLESWRSYAEDAMGTAGTVSIITRGHVRPSGPAQTLCDLRSEAHNRYGVRVPSLYLIRPDKYIGYRSDSLNFAAVTDHLRRCAPAQDSRAGSGAEL